MNAMEGGLVAFFLLVAWILGYYTHLAYGENYEYNFTVKEKQEFNLMSFCYGDAGIEGLEVDNMTMEQWCSERYGSLKNLFGEAIK